MASSLHHKLSGARIARASRSRIFLDTPPTRGETIRRRHIINWITIAGPEEVLDVYDCLFELQKNREGLGISSDLSPEMRRMAERVVGAKEKFSVRNDPNLWIMANYQKHNRQAGKT